MQAPFSYTRPLVGGHDQRARQTIAAMQTVVRAALADPFVVEHAASIVGHADGRDGAAHVQALRSWLAGAVRFLPDPLINGDVIRAPDLLLRQWQRDGVARGDCDDVATLAATLAHAVGLPARFVLAGFGGPDAPFAHVYTEVRTPEGEWVDMDVTETPERRAANPPSRLEAHEVVPGTTPRADGAADAQAAVLGLLGIVEATILGAEAWVRLREALKEAGVL